MVDVTETFPGVQPSINQKSDSQAVPSGQDDLWVDAGDMNDLGQMVVALARMSRLTALITGVAPATEGITDKAFRFTGIDASSGLGRASTSFATDLNKIFAAAVEKIQEGGSLSGTASNTGFFGVKAGLLSGTFTTNTLYGLSSDGTLISHVSGAFAPIAIGLNATTAYVDVGGRFSVDNVTLEFDVNGMLKFIQPLALGDTDINGFLTVSGTTTLSGGLDVAGATVLSGSLRVTGASTFSGSVTMESGLTVQGILEADTSYNIGGVAVLNDTVLSLNETTTPTPVADRGAIFTTTDNELRFQDGDGGTHLVHGDAFGCLWFHSFTSTPDTVEISTANTFTLIDSFLNIRTEDDLGNVVSSVANNEMVLGSAAGGSYIISHHSSVTSATSNSEFVIVPGIQLATVKNVATATAATPIVVTITGHGIDNGDMFTIAGATGDTNVNGDFIAANVTANTIELNTLDGAQRATAGTYDAGTGDVTLVYPGNILIHEIISATSLGVPGNSGNFILFASDIVRLFVANIGATRDLEVSQVNFNITRFAG